jgi:hypothetical protein
VNLINAANLRRIIPGIVVGGVLTFSYFAQIPTLATNLASNGGSGYNCGVKGNGYHDHGKVCPNRPFPGHEKDTEAAEGTQSEDNGTTTEETSWQNNGATTKVSGKVSPGSIKHKTTVSVTATVAPADTEADRSTSDGNGHNSGHAHGNGHGHSNGHGQGD